MDGELTHGELVRAVTSTAAAFAAAGVTPDDTVAVSPASQIQHLVSSLALGYLGARQVAISRSDPAPTQQNVAARLKVGATIAERAADLHTATPLIAPPPPDAKSLRGLPGAALAPAPGGGRPFIYVRTSGTTGLPKLGAVTHDMARHRILPLAIDGPDCRLLSIVDMDFLVTTESAYRCLSAGGCVVIFEGTRILDLAAFARAQRVTYLSGTPMHAGLLLDLDRDGEFLFPDLAAFRLGTAATPDRLRRRILREISPHTFISYGNTELGVIALATPDLVRTIPAVVGAALEGIEAEIVDPQGRAVPPGEPGELRLRAPRMIEGYLDDPEATAKAFRDGWFNTGDLVERAPDGTLVNLRRGDDLMIFDGINISPSEIENVLLRHPGVADAVAFGIRNPSHGDVPTVAVITKSDIGRNDLLAFAKSWLGVRAPKGLLIVDAFPRNSAGKVLRRELATMFLKDYHARGSAEGVKSR
jgi:long-chain acyl-CoA synthetase